LIDSGGASTDRIIIAGSPDRMQHEEGEGDDQEDGEDGAQQAPGEISGSIRGRRSRRSVRRDGRRQRRPSASARQLRRLDPAARHGMRQRGWKRSMPAGRSTGLGRLPGQHQPPLASDAHGWDRRDQRLRV
jgi:hypothetical protein